MCACLYSQTQEREEDQRILNLVGDALRLLGNTLVVLSDLRCNLATSPPRHLYVVRPMAHYTHPVLLQSGLPHMPIPVGQHHTDLLCEIINLGRKSDEFQSIELSFIGAHLMRYIFLLLGGFSGCLETSVCFLTYAIF